MSNVTAYIGRDFGVGEHTTDDVIRTTLKHLSDAGVPGATFSEAIGYWQGDVERSVRVELVGCDVERVHKALTKACVELMQWEIVYVIDGHDNRKIVNDPTEARESYAA